MEYKVDTYLHLLYLLSIPTVNILRSLQDTTQV